jgi:nicotinamidase-related amidase
MIDPQNDFCDIPAAALPVPGADADMRRLAAFLAEAGAAITQLIVTLDSHPTVAIERTSFWKSANGAAVAPFTSITAQDVLARRYLPHDSALLPEVLRYLTALEATGHHTLIVWPVHCVIGTWGHTLQSSIAQALATWEQSSHRNALKILKGQNPLTEQYSAVRAEVPRAEDSTTQTNQILVQAARPTEGLLFVGGEALSHCVAATMNDLFAEMTLGERGRVILLKECMSPVAGFGPDFLTEAARRGARVLSNAQALALLNERT